MKNYINESYICTMALMFLLAGIASYLQSRKTTSPEETDEYRALVREAYKPKRKNNNHNENRNPN